MVTFFDEHDITSDEGHVTILIWASQWDWKDTDKEKLHQSYTKEKGILPPSDADAQANQLEIK